MCVCLYVCGVDREGWSVLFPLWRSVGWTFRAAGVAPWAGVEGGALTDKSCSIIMLTHEGRKAEIPRIICLPDYCLLEACTLSDPKGSLKVAVYGLHK